MSERLNGRMLSWMDGWENARLDERMYGWLAGWLAGLVGG